MNIGEIPVGEATQSVPGAPRETLASRLKAHRKSLLLLAIGAFFLFAAADQLRYFTASLNAFRLYVWVPAGSESVLFRLLTALEIAIGIVSWLPRSRSWGLAAGGILLLTMGLLPIGNLVNLGLPGCGSRYSVIIREPTWQNMMFLLSSGGFLLLTALGNDDRPK